MSVFTEDSKTRKEYPAYSGFIAYFPDAIREVANYVPTAADSYLELYSDAVVRCDWIAAAFYSLKVLEHSEGDPECGGMADGFHGSIHQLLTEVPRSVAAICKLSKEGNDKHNPGQPLHWSRDKSSDHKDCMVRHLIDGDWTELAWRSLANLQVELEGSKKPEMTDSEFKRIVGEITK
jgi:hypothetical protein